MNRKIILIATGFAAFLLAIILVLLLGGRKESSEESTGSEPPSVTESLHATDGDSSSDSESEDSPLISGAVPDESSVSGAPAAKAPEEVYDGETGAQKIDVPNDNNTADPVPQENDTEEYDYGIIPLEPDGGSDKKDAFELPEI